MWLLGPRGIPADWRHMEGFGVHTFKMVNKAGKETYVKFHWKPTCGVKVLTDEEAKEVGMANNVQSHATEDLWNTIESGTYPLLKCTPKLCTAVYNSCLLSISGASTVSACCCIGLSCQLPAINSEHAVSAVSDRLCYPRVALQIIHHLSQFCPTACLTSMHIIDACVTLWLPLTCFSKHLYFSYLYYRYCCHYLCY